jgi:peroxiredoxin
VATAAYLLSKWTVSPALYLFRRAGLPPSIPRRIDSAANRLVLPLTERPDSKRRIDVEPALRRGDPLPDIGVCGSDGCWRSLRSFAAPLLVVFLRGSWCSYSRLHAADVARRANALAAAGIHVLLVSSDGTDRAWHDLKLPLSIAADPFGHVFDALGISLRSRLEFAWGRVLPHESAFLFDDQRRLVACDVRRVSGVTPGQSFLSADVWLNIATRRSEVSA